MSDQYSTPSAAYPGLSYNDAASAIEWLNRVFDFKTRLIVPGSDGSVIHAELSLGDAVIMLGTARPEDGRFSPIDLQGVSAVVSVFVDDPEAHYGRACAAGAEIIQPLEHTPFGARLYLVRDLEQHLWCFGNYRPGGGWEID